MNQSEGIDLYGTDRSTRNTTTVKTNYETKVRQTITTNSTNDYSHTEWTPEP